MTIRGTAGVLLGLFALGASAQAQESVADFYKGKQIRIIVPSAAGGGFDLYARYLARHIGRHIPGNPGIIVQNMPGAGGLAASNHMHTREGSDPRHPGRRADGVRRTLRLRQDDRSAHGRRAGGDHGRRGADRRRGGQPVAAPRSRRRDGVPELRAVPAQVGVRESRLSAEAPPAGEVGGRPEGQTDGTGTRHRATAAAPAATAVGWPATARGDGPGADSGAASVPDGRAPLEPRREASDTDAGRARADPQADRRDDDLRDARPGRGDDARSARRGDAERRAATGRHTAGALQPPQQPLRGGVHRQSRDELLPGHGRAP